LNPIFTIKYLKEPKLAGNFYPVKKLKPEEVLEGV
jgi:hypothetical protein